MTDLNLTLCSVCDIEVTPDGVPGIRVEEGGDVPAWIICEPCMELLDEDARDVAYDNAVTGELHHCIEWAGPSDCCPGLVTCDLCGLALETAGDALVVPED